MQASYKCCYFITIKRVKKVWGEKKNHKPVVLKAKMLSTLVELEYLLNNI